MVAGCNRRRRGRRTRSRRCDSPGRAVGQEDGDRETSRDGWRGVRAAVPCPRDSVLGIDGGGRSAAPLWKELRGGGEGQAVFFRIIVGKSVLGFGFDDVVLVVGVKAGVTKTDGRVSVLSF